MYSAGRNETQEEKEMDNMKIGQYIQSQRKKAGLTQKELADKLSISFQAVSKWENGDTLPDTGILLDLCDILGTTADRLLNGGVLAAGERRLIHMDDVIEGFKCIEDIGRCFGENSTFYTGMVEGINNKMNIDLIPYMNDPVTRDVLYAEALIQAIMSGRTVDMEEIENTLQNKKMIDVIKNYLSKTDEG